MPTKSERLTYDEIVESLYDLTHPQLRKLAVECLLITDGPDRVMRRRAVRKKQTSSLEGKTVSKAKARKVTATPNGQRVRRTFNMTLGGYTYNGIDKSKCQCNLSAGTCKCGHYEVERDKEIARRASANTRRKWSA